MMLVVFVTIGFLGITGVIQATQLKEEKNIFQNDNSDDTSSLFDDFIKTYNKLYKDKNEYNRRLKIFENNMKRAQELQKTQKGTAEYGVTKFADLTVEEFKQLGSKPSPRPASPLRYPKAEIPDIELPKNFDWRHFNVVTPVKNQGDCSCGWAFSTTGNIEGQYAIKYQSLISLSEQVILDCDPINTDGCNYGMPFLAYQSIGIIGGLELESDYPYTGEISTCEFSKKKVVVQLAGAVELSTNENDIAKWLVKNGPVSIQLNPADMQLYKKGISHPKSCNPYKLDHSALIVGYGVKQVKNGKNSRKIPYWIIKNSFGTSFGENGYYRLYRGKGLCGVNLNPSSAVVA